jgi:hypothetical protein
MKGLAPLVRGPARWPRCIHPICRSPLCTSWRRHSMSDPRILKNSRGLGLTRDHHHPRLACRCSRALSLSCRRRWHAISETITASTSGPIIGALIILVRGGILSLDGLSGLVEVADGARRSVSESALGHKRKCCHARVMSVLPLKADISNRFCWALGYRGLDPNAPPPDCAG